MVATAVLTGMFEVVTEAVIGRDGDADVGVRRGKGWLLGMAAL